MSPEAFLQLIQTYVARVAIGPSTVRGQGAGVAGAGRVFCSNLELTDFAVKSEGAFNRCLETATLDLQAAMPHGTRSWGMARKMLNIFLCDSLYNRQLAEAYGLKAVERFLEVPLDSVTSSYLRKRGRRGELPPWLGVKHLEPRVSKLYQAKARQVAETQGFARVHLDAYWWGGRPAKSEA